MHELIIEVVDAKKDVVITEVSYNEEEIDRLLIIAESLNMDVGDYLFYDLAKTVEEDNTLDKFERVFFRIKP